MLVLLVLVVIALVLVAKDNPGNESALVGSYIMEHISELSPEKEVLGGTYYVTNIAVTPPDMGTVQYEDGHVAHIAKFNYRVQKGSVVISNFKITEPQSSNSPVNNFDENGNLTDGTRLLDGWSLVYEKPGQPALKVKLVFSSNTLCRAGTNEIICFAISSDRFLSVGDRVRIEGQKIDDVIVVSRATKLD